MGIGDQTFTLAKLWHDIARHQLHWVKSWQVQATFLDVHLPKSGKVRIVFVRASKKQWHAFLSTDVSMELPDILKYYSRRWAIEVYFRDCKQMLYLGQGQSETFDAVIALASIVMLRYLLLVYILAKRHLIPSCVLMSNMIDCSKNYQGGSHGKSYQEHPPPFQRGGSGKDQGNGGILASAKMAGYLECFS